MADWGPFSLEGRNAVVTGGAMGIGRGIAARFLEAGANVLIADIDEAAAQQTASELAGGTTSKVTAVQLDVTADGAGEALVERVVEEFGSIEILVNNAGIYPIEPMLEMPVETFDRIQSINVRALAYCSQAAGRRMVEQGEGGSIINLASIDGFHPTSVGLTAYDTSKGGVVMFTKGLALELAPHGVRVNAIAPGPINTEGTSGRSGASDEERERTREAIRRRIPLGRQGEPDDIAKAAVFLASPAADFVTGETVIVDGGFLLS
jgi:2-deoxy-D-gluconate 3-dehydrogenase